MIVFKKISFIDTEDVVDEKLETFVNLKLFVDTKKDGEPIICHPKYGDLISINDEIREYSYEDREKREALVVTRKEVWDKFICLVSDAGVKYKEEDIQDKFFGKEIENDFFETKANLYMLRHMSVDEVLDKMNKYGKKSLTEIDYEILKKAKNLS